MFSGSQAPFQSRQEGAFGKGEIMEQGLVRLSVRPNHDAESWETLDEVRGLRDQSDEQHQRQLFADYLLWQEIKRLQQQIVVLTHHVVRQQLPPAIRGVRIEFAGDVFMGFPCTGCDQKVWTTKSQGCWRGTCPKCKTQCVRPVEPPNV
jgi:hypothetical protein